MFGIRHLRTQKVPVQEKLSILFRKCQGPPLGEDHKTPTLPRASQTHAPAEHYSNFPHATLPTPPPAHSKINSFHYPQQGLPPQRPALRNPAIVLRR